MHEAVREPDRARRDGAVRRAPRLARGAAGRPARAAAHRAQHGRPGSRRARPGKRARSCSTSTGTPRRSRCCSRCAARSRRRRPAPRGARRCGARHGRSSGLGRVTEAAEVLAEGRADAEGAAATSEERAEIAYLTAICCYTLSQISAAQLEFARALRLLDETGEPNNRLRLDIHQWRSRCYRQAARLGGGTGGHRSRAGALRGDRRRPSQRRGQPAGLARRGAAGALGPGPPVCGDLARPLPRRRRHCHGGACPQQPRRPEPLARQRRDRDRAAPGGVCDLRRREPRGRGRLRSQLACRDSPRAGRSRRGRGGGESRARPARGARRPHPGDRDGATRPRAGATRTGRARAGRGDARRRRCELRAHGVDQPPGPLVDDPRGARAACAATMPRLPACTARRLRRCSHPISKRRRGPLPSGRDPKGESPSPKWGTTRPP